MQHGKSASISLGANDISPYCSGITFERDNDTHDITTFGNTAHKYLAGLVDGKMTVTGFWDKTATVGSDTVISPLVGDADGVAFIYGPEGTTSGNVKYSGTVILESYAQSAPVAEFITFTAQFKISDTVTVGTFS